MARTVNVMDAARMTAATASETANRVSQYFGDAGPFSYGKVRALTAPLLNGELPYRVIIAGLEAIQFDLARRCNLDVAELLWSRMEFRGCTFYPLKQIAFTVDKDFSVGIRPETVAVVDGTPHLIFVQPRKTPTPWCLDARFMKRLLEEVYADYFDEARFFLIDTEALDGARKCRLVNLEDVTAMDDREFTRRIASLRQAWRLHLSDPRPQKDRKKRPDDRQSDFGI